MADTARTRSAILTLFADNVTGQISAQDLRDFTVTVMPAEFAYANDFWNMPLLAQLTAEGTRGTYLYSQVADSAIAFGTVVYMTPSGTWKNADCADSAKNCRLAIAASAITSGDSGILLHRGLVFKSAYSALFSGYIGRAVYLASGVAGSVLVIAPSQPKVIGVVENDTNGLFRFEADWTVVGA